MIAPPTRTNLDEVTLAEVVNALDYLVSHDASLDPADGGTGMFADLGDRSPITRWVIGDGVAGLSIEAADGRSFTLTITAPTTEAPADR